MAHPYPVDKSKIWITELESAFGDIDFDRLQALASFLEVDAQNSEKPGIQALRLLTHTAIDSLAFNVDDIEARCSDEIESSAEDFTAIPKIYLFEFLRLKAQKYYFLNEAEKLAQIVQGSEKILLDEKITNKPIHFLNNSIKLMYLSTIGEHRQALALCRVNLTLNKTVNFQGISEPFDALYVQSISLMAMSEMDEAMKILQSISQRANEVKFWSWYLVAHGQIARQLATENHLIDALAMIRVERELIDSLHFKNQLSILCDANELYVRLKLRDDDRIETLINRLPDITLVKQIRAAKLDWKGIDMLRWIESLPFSTPREQIYKLFCLAEYHVDNQNLSTEYMGEALPIIERTGATEFLLRQHHLFGVILRAIQIQPTPYLENVLSKISHRIAEISKYSIGELTTPLTPRELEILHSLNTGMTVKAIGEMLGISINTMKTHVKNIYKKLNARSRSEALEKAAILLLT